MQGGGLRLNFTSGTILIFLHLSVLLFFLVLFSNVFDIFVCAVSAVALSTSSDSATNNCSIVVDAEDGAAVNFPCNSSCISGNVIQWNHYIDTNDFRPTLLFNGDYLNPNWSSKGIMVDNDHTHAASVLSIEKVTKSHAGIYECFGDKSASITGCKMHFCLTTGRRPVLSAESVSSVAGLSFKLTRFFWAFTFKITQTSNRPQSYADMGR